MIRVTNCGITNYNYNNRANIAFKANISDSLNKSILDEIGTDALKKERYLKSYNVLSKLGGSLGRVNITDIYKNNFSETVIRLYRDGTDKAIYIPVCSKLDAMEYLANKNEYGFTRLEDEVYRLYLHDNKK